jgi:hypothetical protein
MICLCECYMMRSGRVWVNKLFMWMLHEVYMNVYVNVTWWEVEEFEWMKRLCEWCYMMRSRSVLFVNDMFMWMLHDEKWKSLSEWNVYVNVTWSLYECLCECYMMRSGRVWVNETFMWMMLHDEK